jgi:small subunit ribosomal protein S19e
MALTAATRNFASMTTLYDVPAEALVDALAEGLADEDDIEAPAWAAHAKTGADRELPPEQGDFWERRAGSLLRKVAVDGPVGVNSLRTEYGGPKQGSNRYRVRPPAQQDASGSVIRTALQQLESAGYVDIRQKQGREITPEGRALLDEVAAEVIEDLDRPDLERYA